MAKIIKDLVGVVYVDDLVLRAGDDIPESVAVGDHLVAQVKRGRPAAKKPVSGKQE